MDLEEMRNGSMGLLTSVGSLGDIHPYVILAAVQSCAESPVEIARGLEWEVLENFSQGEID